MSALNLAAVMRGAASVVDAVIPGTCWAWPVEAVQPGDGVVGYPTDPIAFDATYSRGSDRLTLPVWIIAGMPQDETTMDTVSGLVDGSGSVATALNGTLNGSCSDATARTARIDRFEQLGGLQLVTVLFLVDVIT